jgi:hypothetical protein
MSARCDRSKDAPHDRTIDGWVERDRACVCMWVQAQHGRWFAACMQCVRGCWSVWPPQHHIADRYIPGQRNTDTVSSSSPIQSRSWMACASVALHYTLASYLLTVPVVTSGGFIDRGLIASTIVNCIGLTNTEFCKEKGCTLLSY